MQTGYTLVRQKMRRVIFVFPIVTFSCDTDHKSSFHSTQLTLIQLTVQVNQSVLTFSCHMVKRYIFFPKDWLNRLIKGTANRTGASGYMIAKKKNIIKKKCTSQ